MTFGGVIWTMGAQAIVLARTDISDMIMKHIAGARRQPHALELNRTRFVE